MAHCPAPTRHAARRAVEADAMLAFGPLAFTAPWMLLGLAALPAIWWLLKISPPLPKRVRFPAIRLLIGLAREDETPAHTPLWLLLLRSVLATLIVLALANPLWNPAPVMKGTGPLLIVVDNGWASATHWRERSNTLNTLIAGAGRDNRPTLVLGTVPGATPPALDFAAADDAAAHAAALTPQPLAPDRAALAARLRESASLNPHPQVIWLSDGMDYGAADAFAKTLAGIASNAGVEIIEPRANARALALPPPDIAGDGLVARVLRAPDSAALSGNLHAMNAQGAILASAAFHFSPNAGEAETRFDLPLELRNKISRIEVAGENSAGAVSLLDESARRRTVGLLSGSSIEEGQRLLSDLYYLERAIGPYAALRLDKGEHEGRSDIQAMLSQPLSVLILADIGHITAPDREALTRWIDKGGVLVRFAGPKLTSQNATHGPDTLMPVSLRTGGRALGGAMSWTSPQHLAPFEAGSPFFGLDIPDDVTVTRQVLAEPTLDLGSHTWARLKDGTPLVTAATRGKGLVILFHVTANSSWSNLPLSGLFVTMLRRVVALSQGERASNAATDTSEATLSPVRTLDGYGKLGNPPALATPVPAKNFDTTKISPRHPPGLYGPADNPRALNLIRPGLKLVALDALPDIGSRHAYAETAEIPLRPALLALAMLLILIDGIAALYVTGLFDTTPIRRRRRGLNILPVLIFAFTIVALLPLRAAHADSAADKFALDAANNTRLAYVLTGDAETDAISRAGLEGLSAVLRARTSFNPAPPMGLNIAKDELAFFPLLYWPMAEGQDNLSPETLARINTYMEHGGVILFDTRDQDLALTGIPGPGTQTLRRLIGQLDLPALQPVPDTHVLTKSFYLIQTFPGRWSGGTLWVQSSNAGANKHGGRANDGVSSILVGSNNYAAAWARDDAGRPMFPCEPGGEQQREMAYRFGVNLVMYTLTGNYKSDQVHTPALLERLGQ
jgi:hypothetical protein